MERQKASNVHLRPSGSAGFLATKTGVCRQVSSDTFTGKVMNISINHAYILVLYSRDCHIPLVQLFRYVTIHK